jgi:hypothetical protein
MFASLGFSVRKNLFASRPIHNVGEAIGHSRAQTKESTRHCEKRSSRLPAASLAAYRTWDRESHQTATLGERSHSSHGDVVS